MALVLDSSALVTALLDNAPSAVDTRRRLRNDVCHSPHLIDAEVGNMLRRRVVRGELGDEEAERVLDDARSVVDHRYAVMGGIGRAAWRLRHNLTFYDAVYVGLAAVLRVTLLTDDRRLKRAPGLPCDVELVTAEKGS
jgi:predicted nucleic acid-binding protein